MTGLKAIAIGLFLIAAFFAAVFGGRISRSRIHGIPLPSWPLSVASVAFLIGLVILAIE